MKKIVFLFLGVFLLTTASENLFAQRTHRKLTVILLRHAEKDLTDANTANPILSAAGEARAARLVEIANRFEPDVIYSTNYIRTRATARPLARSRNAMTLIYDERKLPEMRDLILSGKFKRIVVVGHNSTTPALVNMLLKENKYKTLAESEYDKIYVVQIRKYKRKPEKVRETVMQY